MRRQGRRNRAPETTDVPRDQKGPEPIAEIPAQTAYLSLRGKYAVRQDWVVGTTGEPLLSYIKYLQEGAG